MGQGGRVLFFGRFQPFHKGHMSALEWLGDRFEEVVVLVGMADESHTWFNPFTAGERLWMIREAVRGTSLDGRVITATIPTLRVFKGYVSYVLSYVPPVEAVATVNPPVARCFEESGVRVVKPPVVGEGLLHGEVVRCLMLLGDDRWRELVPAPVARVLEEIGAVQRLRAVVGDEQRISACRRLAQQR